MDAIFLDAYFKNIVKTIRRFAPLFKGERGERFPNPSNYDQPGLNYDFFSRTPLYGNVFKDSKSSNGSL